MVAEFVDGSCLLKIEDCKWFLDVRSSSFCFVREINEYEIAVVDESCVSVSMN